jgi:hypothetical protein
MRREKKCMILKGPFMFMYFDMLYIPPRLSYGFVLVFKLAIRAEFFTGAVSM